MTKCLRFSVLAVIVLSGQVGMPMAYAATVSNSEVTSTHEQANKTSTSTVGTAQDWSLSDREWGDYQKLMQGAAGKWYPQLTPTEVLGMFADNPQDQQHFAEMAAKEQHDKIAREIAFNNIFHQAMHRLYADEPVIKLFDMSAFNPIQRNNKESGSPIGSFSSFH